MDVPSESGRPWARLLLWSSLALVVFRLVDTTLYRLLAAHAAPFAVLADVRVPSLLVLGAAFATSPGEMRLWTRAPDAQVVKVAALWLVGAFVSARFLGFGIVHLPRTEDVVAHVLTGAIAEELVCRGLVLGAALLVWPAATRRWTALLWSAVVFALMHLQYHAFRLDGRALAQLAWTLPEGFVFGFVALRTRSLAVAMAVHVLNNALVLAASRM